MNYFITSFAHFYVGLIALWFLMFNLTRILIAWSIPSCFKIPYNNNSNRAFIPYICSMNPFFPSALLNNISSIKLATMISLILIYTLIGLHSICPRYQSISHVLSKIGATINVLVRSHSDQIVNKSGFTVSL